MSVRILNVAIGSVVGTALAAVVACSEDRSGFETPPATFEVEEEVDAGTCPLQCSLDGRSVIRSCNGEVVETCADDLACGAASCQEPCAAAAADKSSNGCEFYFMQPSPAPENVDSCFATFVVNTSAQPTELELELDGTKADLAKAMFRTTPGDATLIPHSGPIAPGESIVLFVSDRDPAIPASGNGSKACPSGVVPAYLVGRSMRTSGIGSSFHLKATKPVSTVAMYPFGGATSFLPATTLLLPSVTWGTQHILVGSWEATHFSVPQTYIVASSDDSEVTILPSVEIQNGRSLKGGPAKVPLTYRLNQGEYLQFTQAEELTGSTVLSNKPTTVFSSHSCANVPRESGACDVLFQQIPTFEQWGAEYAAVGYRPRVGNEHEPMPYRIVAARDGTRLDYDPAIPAGAPTELSAGESATFPAGVGDAFVVRSQDAEHPFYLGAYMTGRTGGYYGSPDFQGAGDPDFVNVIPAQQWLNSYSFYADPTYGETSLVIVRAKSHGSFKDVWLECAGNLADWKPIGTRGQYEYVRVDLSREGRAGDRFGDKVCQTGLQRMRSEGPFTATLWGWDFAASYAYPGGMAHRKLVETPLDPLR